MNQRGVTIIATYLDKRPLGRIVQVRNVGEDDYILAIDDVRDGRTQLIHSAGDLRLWLESFRHGECLPPAAAVCGRCASFTSTATSMANYLRTASHVRASSSKLGQSCF